MLRESHRPGIEPATCKWQVQRRTAEPPRNSATIVYRRVMRGELTEQVHDERIDGERKRPFISIDHAARLHCTDTSLSHIRVHLHMYRRSCRKVGTNFSRPNGTLIIFV